MSDAELVTLAKSIERDGFEPFATAILWRACVERVTHGITTMREDKGWRILKTQGGGVGVVDKSWGKAVQLFAMTLI